MRILVMMMWANIQPSIRNLDAFVDSVVKPYKEHIDEYSNDFHFCAYYSSREGCDDVWLDDKTNEFIEVYGVNEDEGIYRTYEKTYKMFKYACDNMQFDLIVRINVSMWLNLRLLDEVCSQFKDDVVYCNAINTCINGSSEYVNDLYPRGDLMIMHRSVAQGIVKVGGKYMYEDANLNKRIGVDHVDDCIIGICLIDLYGREYFKHIIPLRYNYCPDSNIVLDKFDEFAIGSRLKSTPPNMHSGYSWDDNDYRLNDVTKFNELKNISEPWRSDDFKGVMIDELIVPRDKSRPTIFIEGVSKRIDETILKYLINKR